MGEIFLSVVVHQVTCPRRAKTKYVRVARRMRGGRGGLGNCLRSSGRSQRLGEGEGTKPVVLQAVRSKSAGGRVTAENAKAEEGVLLGFFETSSRVVPRYERVLMQSDVVNVGCCCKTVQRMAANSREV